MMTDPPHPLDSTTVLKGKSGLSLYTTYPNGPSGWVSTGTDFNLDMLAIVNKKQTVASVTMPYGSAVKKVRFNIASLQNADAIPLAAASLSGYGIVLTPAVGAVLISASTVIVAVNARFKNITEAQNLAVTTIREPLTLKIPSDWMLCCR